MASLTALKTRIAELVASAVTAAGYDLEELVVTRVGRRLLVRVVVDGDAGVTLDTVADVSRLISDRLDTADQDFTAEPYTLEVSSPGVDRPLTQARHWRRAVGRLVKTAAGTGRVISATDQAVTLDFDGATRELPFAKLGPGKVQVEFNRMDEAFPAGLVPDGAGMAEAELIDDEDEKDQK
jgi:ribosome maturation factor RimP